jgi:hypothetical protein
MLERRAIALTQDIRPKLDRQVGTDAEEISVERRVMEAAQSKSVGEHRFAAGMTIGQYVSRVEQLPVAEPAHRASGLIRVQDPLAEPTLVESPQSHDRHVSTPSLSGLRLVSRS